MNGRFCKLPDGSWGVKVKEEMSIGESLLVEKQSGETQTVAVGEKRGTNSYGDHMYAILRDDPPEGGGRPARRRLPTKPVLVEGEDCPTCGVKFKVVDPPPTPPPSQAKPEDQPF